MRKILPVLLAPALALAACGQDPDRTATVDEHERQVGAEQHEQLLAQFGGGYEGPEADYLDEVGQKLAATSGLEGDCTFTLVNSDVVNAFAVPGCYIYLTRGLMALVNSEAELAAVLAHELGHIARDHSDRQQRRSILRQLGVLAVGLATDSQLLTQVAGGAAQFFTLRYSRAHEHEADDFSVRTLVSAGYDPHAAADMLEALGRNDTFQQQGDGADLHAVPEWGRTHPLTENRIERVRQAADAAGRRPGELPEREAAFLEQVDGLLYGDDPRQGFVLAGRFAHPDLRIAFQVPEGFRLTNSPEAVLIEGPNGLRGEFSGGEIPAGGLEDYAAALVRRAFGDGAELSRADRTSVNGFPAIIVPLQLRTSEGAVEALVAAYASDAGSAYHFLLVAPPGEQLPPQVTDLVGSFERLSPAEAARLRPRVIDVVAAPQGATAERLAAMMASDRPLEHFLVLNDRSAGEPIPAGERVKIIRFGSPER